MKNGGRTANTTTLIETRAARFYRELNRVTATAQEESDIFDAFCRLSVSLLGCDASWAGFIVELNGRLIIPAAFCGDETGCIDPDIISIRCDDPACGGAGQAVEKGSILCINNLNASPDDAGWQKEMSMNGFSSFCAVPIYTDAKVSAVFCALSKTENFFTEDLLGFLIQASEEISFSVEAVSARSKDSGITGKGLIEKFGVLFNNTSDAIFVHEMQGDNIYEGRFTEVNYAACSKLGCSREELIKCNFEMLNECSSFDYEAIRRSLLKTGHAHFESKLTCSGGTSFPVRISSHSFTMDGRSYIISIVRDISEKVRTIKQLTLLQNIIEHSTVSVVITDREGRIEYVNPVFEKITGYTAEEAAGENPRLLKSDMTDQKVFEDLWKTISSGKTWKGEFRNRKKNGELCWESAIIFPVKDHTGEITNYIGVKEDVTDKKQLEEQVRHAQRLNIIGEMAGSFAHDLKNIILIIGGFANRLEKKLGADSTEHEYTVHIMKAVAKAAKLTNGLLTFGRKQPNKPQCLNINLLLSEYLELVEKIADDKIKVVLNLCGKSLPIVADSVQLEQVLMNLASNAKDAMPDGGTLTISSFLIETAEGKAAKIVFEDTGCGMTKEVCSRIFDPFYTTKDPGKGTGLGLSIVYGIIRQHNGEIHCTSAEGKGSVFTIILPVYEKALTE